MKTPASEQPVLLAETCTLITTLLDEATVPAGVLRDAYPNWWTA